MRTLDPSRRTTSDASASGNDSVSIYAIVVKLRTGKRGSDADPVDVVSIRVYARVEAPDTMMDYERLLTRPRNGGTAHARSRPAYFGQKVGFIDTPIISRGALNDAWCPGPLIIEEYDATCVVPHDAKARLDALGNIEIELPTESEA